MESHPSQTATRRVYPLDNRDLTEEQIAVVFAMTSRSPEPFDEIAQRVSEEKAADFHERWVLDYGHASVAEHAVVHLAVENISRLACDALESNRLASYTEKSSRYQVIERDSFHTPLELGAHPELRETFDSTCRKLFDFYMTLLDQTMAHLRDVSPIGENERKSAYELRVRRIATDACRGVLPAAILTNVGMTANARTLEHAISKLMSSSLQETQDLGLEIREQGRNITPTLIKYADPKPYLKEKTITAGYDEDQYNDNPYDESRRETRPLAKLVEWTPDPTRTLTAAILYRGSEMDYSEARMQAKLFGQHGRAQIIEAALEDMSPHDPAPKEFETISFTFEFCMDYGALREFRRHRMQTLTGQPLTVKHGVNVPKVIGEAGLEETFREATSHAESAFRAVAEKSPKVAQYLVTHAHQQLVLSTMNLRECYHVFRLRTSERAHESIRGPMNQALDQAIKIHPMLFKALREKAAQ